ncbi:histidine phosphatase family protein [Corynebacterium sp. zg-331]|uniref:histidine phosphatase family protein n=1 Tax=unclassified Corynebacterium TaxID=2624378 RepID=UPI00128B5569|nr:MULTISPECIES: histidine phosphatase family protein [unclassified Corynebacterium]MBC3186834.1 histidine phosphatase family protein [Corynebacterium sp. zg-331]MPV53314.1 histidine phosphatase family protein [Corynebacterium sp. zg331]
MTTPHLILLRHGRTYSNASRLLDTRPPGAELTEIGRAQAREAGCALAARPGRVREIVTSVALRAQQTAMGAAAAYEEARGLPRGRVLVTVRAGLHEVSVGDLEMRGDDAAHRAYQEAFAGWLRGEDSARLPGGEGYRDVLGRFRPVLEELAASLRAAPEAGDVVVVSHGGAIRTVSTHATGANPEAACAAYLANCQYIELAPGIRDFGQWGVVRWDGLDQG